MNELNDSLEKEVREVVFLPILKDGAILIIKWLQFYITIFDNVQTYKETIFYFFKEV